MHKLQLSDDYIAGWWDGEGCFGVYAYPPRAVLVASASATFHPILEHMKEKYGGSLGRKTKMSPDHKPAWQWQITGNGAARFAADVLPRLHEKRRQAELLLEAHSLAKPLITNVRFHEIVAEIKAAKTPALPGPQ